MKKIVVLLFALTLFPFNFAFAQSCHVALIEIFKKRFRHLEYQKLGPWGCGGCIV